MVLNPSSEWFLSVQFLGFAVVAVFLLALILKARARFRRKYPDLRNIGLREVLRGLGSETGRIVIRGDPATAILGLTGLMLLIGLFLLVPLETFSSSPSYAHLQRTSASEAVWGLGLCSLAVLKLLLLGYSSIESIPFSPTAFYLSTLLNAIMTLVYFNIALGVLVSNVAGFGWVTYLFLAAGSLWCAARRLRQAQGGR